MSKIPLDNFLNECVCTDSEADGLSLEELYGLYLSWCQLRDSEPVDARTLRASLRAAGVAPSHRGKACPGLVMVGPAACDYIVHRELPLATLDTQDEGAPQIRSRRTGAHPIPLQDRESANERDAAPAA
ncbi:hypothetical protein GCM10023063_21760 [Arthrobacter methylotrophus]|uniref:DNA primase/nucleoside triphosphatase C-terminal domain-containing protein n=1 Tax=Arthrobacter methylotrophus TaxID=121291 RepID=A0ABV5UML2_9MICC